MKKLVDISIAKARYGRYEDTAENRRLHRVGQEYGKKGAGEDGEGKLSKKEQRQERLKKYKAALEKFDKLLNSSNLEEDKRKQVEELRGKLENKVERLEARMSGSKSQPIKEQAPTPKPENKREIGQSKVKDSKDNPMSEPTYANPQKLEINGEVRYLYKDIGGDYVITPYSPDKNVVDAHKILRLTQDNGIKTLEDVYETINTHWGGYKLL